jgi:hypothetical protein
MNDLAPRFHQLFRGLDRAYGTYRVNGERSEQGKANGSGQTIRGTVTDELWEQHLTGEQRLGVVPVRDDGQAYFGAIDVDTYDLDHAALEHRVKTLRLPLVTCRSKSGGAHLYLFTTGVDAALLREALARWATALGFPGIEIFPKQSRLANKDDVGNWLNMPYFDAELTTTYAVYQGKALSVSDFLAQAEGARLSADQLRAVEVQGIDLPEGAPPCLHALAMNGVPEGMRNNALFAFGVLARLSGGDAWGDVLQEFNGKFMDPPLSFSEVGAITKSLSRKNYYYPCEKPPLPSFCDKAACRKCEYGVGSGDGPVDPGIIVDSITKVLTDPPTWIFCIAGVNVELDTADFISQTRFKQRVVEKLNRLPRTMKPGKWDDYVNAKLANVIEEAAPEDASSHGQFLTHLRDFCNRQSRGTTKESLVTNGLYHDEERGLIYFRSTYLEKYLDQQKFRDFSGRRVWTALRKVPGIKHGQEMVKGRFINWWSVPLEDVAKEDFTVPQVGEEEF